MDSKEASRIGGKKPNGKQTENTREQQEQENTQEGTSQNADAVQNVAAGGNLPTDPPPT